MKISAVIITKNEEQNIQECLESLIFCDEIIVIDDNSTDKTVEIAKSFGAKVYERALNSDFSAQRNYGLSKAKGEWVLFVDADEVVSPKLAEEIKEATKSEYSGFYIKRVGVIDEYILRLGKGGKWHRKIHEEWSVKGKVGKLSSPLLHSPTFQLKSFLAKINYYSTLHAKSNSIEGKKSNLIKIIFWPIYKFFYYFVIKRGYRAKNGFVFSALMGAHSFLSWAKLWELQKDK